MKLASEKVFRIPSTNTAWSSAKQAGAFASAQLGVARIWSRSVAKATVRRWQREDNQVMIAMLFHIILPSISLASLCGAVILLGMYSSQGQSPPTIVVFGMCTIFACLTLTWFVAALVFHFALAMTSAFEDVDIERGSRRTTRSGPHSITHLNAQLTSSSVPPPKRARSQGVPAPASNLGIVSWHVPKTAHMASVLRVINPDAPGSSGSVSSDDIGRRETQQPPTSQAPAPRVRPFTEKIPGSRKYQSRSDPAWTRSVADPTSATSGGSRCPAQLPGLDAAIHCESAKPDGRRAEGAQSGSGQHVRQRSSRDMSDMMGGKPK